MLVNGLSFDIEWHFPLDMFFKSFDRKKLMAVGRDQIVGNVHKVMDILSRRSIKATFFITGDVAEYFPEIVGEIARDGHEIGCHGYEHKAVYLMTAATFREQLFRAKTILENSSGGRVVGYRAPAASIDGRVPWAVSILKDAGFHYDSSMLSCNLMDGFKPAGSGLYRDADGFMELPLGSISAFGRKHAMAGGGCFRFFPYDWTRSVILRNNRDGNPVFFYLHQWELDPKQPKLLPCKMWLRCYGGIRFVKNRLERLLDDFSFTTYQEIIKKAVI